jgi:molecular chaperone GrpE
VEVTDTVDGSAEPQEEGPTESEAVAEAISALADQVAAHHARAEARERVIDQLHAEVERLRVGGQGVVLRPAVTDLQHLRDDLLRQARTLPAEVSGEQVKGLLESFALSAELALERCGCVPVRPETGAVFSGREHRAVKVVETQRPEQDGTVADVLTDGYVDATDQRVLTPARVHVWRWTASQPEERPEPAEQTEESTDD